MIAGAIALSATVDPGAAARDIADRMNRFDTLQAQPLLASERVCVLGLFNPSFASGLGPPGGDAPDGLWIIGDTTYAPERCRDRLHRQIRAGFPIPRDAPGRHIALRRVEHPDGVELLTDVLGTMPVFIGRRSDALLFATDFGAVAVELRGALTVDVERALMELVFGSFPDDRTVFREICVAPANAVVRLDARGLTIVEQRSLEFGDAHVGETDAQKFAHLDAIFEDVTEHYLRPYSEQLALSLSTGFDSRYGLALATRAGIDVDCITFGHPQSLEVFGARRVARGIGRETELFEIPDSEWQSWRHLVQLAGSCGTVQWCGWSDRWGRHLAREHRAVMIGYLGDSMSGVRLNFDPIAQDWLEHWLRVWSTWAFASADGVPSFVRPALATRALEIGREMLGPRLEGLEFALPHQGAHALNLLGRQRRHVSSQPNLLAHFLVPVTYLYHGRLLEFCANLPFEDLHAQRLYLAYARSRFPELFPKRSGQIVYSAMERVRNKARDVARSLIGAGGPAARPPVVDRNRIVMPNRDEIKALARRTRSVAADLIDADEFCRAVDRFDAANLRGSAQTVIATNLLLLLEAGVS